MFAAWLRPENKQKHRKSHRRHVRLSPAGTVTKPHDTFFFFGYSAAPLPRCYRATKTQRAVTGGCELLACLHSLSLACRSNNRCFTCSFPFSSTTHSLNATPNSYTLIPIPTSNSTGRLPVSTTPSREHRRHLKMDRASGAHAQRDSDEASSHNGRGGRRTYSHASDNSGSPASKNRSQPILRSTPGQSYALPPKRHTGTSAVPLNHEHRNHSINGNNIKETFRPRSKAYASSQSSSKSPSPSKGSSRSRHGISGTQDTQAMPLVKRSNDSWALDQDSRLKLVNIPKEYWMKDVYFAVSRYGTVVKIEMIVGSRGNDAIVILQ
jgi:hypothetical protein